MQVIKYNSLESKTFDARNISIVFKKGEKLELALDKEVSGFKIKVFIPSINSNYLLQQYALSKEEMARKDFEKYLKKLESGRYALYITEELTAELVPRKSYTVDISQTIRGNNY